MPVWSGSLGIWVTIWKTIHKEIYKWLTSAYFSINPSYGANIWFQELIGPLSGSTILSATLNQSAFTLRWYQIDLEIIPCTYFWVKKLTRLLYTLERFDQAARVIQAIIRHVRARQILKAHNTNWYNRFWSTSTYVQDK